MPRAFAFSPGFQILRLSLILICITGWGVAETLALTPCGSPLSAGFRARTLDIQTVGINVGFSSVAVGDFNNDGRADAAVTTSYNSFSNTIYIFLGNAASGLTLSGSAMTISQPTDIAVTEFNSDGKLDLVVNNGNTIQTLVGDGSGGFNPVITYSVNSTWLATGDFNGDGKQDIAAAPRFSTPGRISIFLGFGTGTYAAPFDTLTGNEPDDLKAADMNGDGKLDLVTVNRSTGVSVLLNNGSGGFSSPTHFSTSTVMANQSLAVGDFDNDTKLDVVVANGGWPDNSYFAPTMVILLGNGTGGLGAATPFNLGANFSGIVAGDFTGDGKLDVVGVNNIKDYFGNKYPGTLVLLAGNGSGGFTISDTTGVGYSPGTLAVGDFNNDGKLDVIVPNSYKGLNTSPDISVLLGSCNASHIKSDYDGDGKADFAVWRPSDGNWRIALSAYQNVVTNQQWGQGALGDKPAPGDYDGDGKADLAVFRPSQGTWYIQNSSDNSVRATQWGANGDKPVPGDYDGDLKTDVAVFRPSTGAWYVLRSSDQTFFGVGFGISTDKTVQGDYDGDGKTDIAVWRPGNGYWYILNSADNSFRAQPWGTNGDVPVPGDYDGDSVSDLAVYRPGTNRWYVFRPDAPGQYIERTVGTNADTPAPADYDGDGLTDFTMWRPSLGFFSIIKSFDGVSTASPALGSGLSEVAVSTSYAPE